MSDRKAFYAKLRDGGGIVFIHRCSVCDSEDAPFGVGVHLNKFPKQFGKWFCWIHWLEYKKTLSVQAEQPAAQTKLFY